MSKYKGYNVFKYLKSITEMKNMNFEGILGSYQKCLNYDINPNVKDYLKYINDEPFYVSPSFTDIKTDVKISTLNPKFIIFSAPGATGKSSLAKYISYRFGSLYWDLSKIKLGENSFAGSILQAVGANKYSQFIQDLNDGKVMLTIDAFDEAEIISGRKMLNCFISDISQSLNSNEKATVILLARTETAQYLASFCAENKIPALHYEIGFFIEEQAKSFIRSLIAKKRNITPAIEECINSYYDLIKNNISNEESTSFLGYAPVLEAISTHIQTSSNTASLLQKITGQHSCASIIIEIMDDLLLREQGKVVAAFMEKSLEAHPEFEQWGIVYSAEEQLIRIVNYVLFNDTKYDNYPVEGLPNQLVEDYQNLLDIFLCQHPFIQNSLSNNSYECSNFSFTGPAFRDFSLSKLLLDDLGETCVQLYLEEANNEVYFPSQIFFDCYTQINDSTILSSHISYVYESYRAKATGYERPYLQVSEFEDSQNEGVAIFGMQTLKDNIDNSEMVLDLKFNSKNIYFEQLSNVSIDVPNRTVVLGRAGADCCIRNSSIICDKIKWGTDKIVIESFVPEGVLISSKNNVSIPAPTIDIAYSDNLRVSIPNISECYRFIPYKYELENSNEIDVIKFTYALRNILMEFRTHKKDTLAKTAERIDFVTVGKNEFKQKVISFLKTSGVVYESDHLYKIDTSKMQNLGISFIALSRMDTSCMDQVFKEFCDFLKTQ